MGEWALPRRRERVVFTRPAPRRARPGTSREARWLRGAFWRNFQVRYREINDLHKQMLRVSDKVAAMPEGPARLAALDHLHRGQSNDCYWHGLFGGIYISHMRLATHEHLVAAEDAADALLGTAAAAELLDLDLDGRDEVRLADAGQVVTVKPTRARASAPGTSGRRATRWPPSCAAGPRRTTRSCAPTRPAATDAAPAPGRRRRGLDPRHRHGQGGWPGGPPPLRRPRAPFGPGPLPGAGRHAGGRCGRRRGGAGDFRDGEWQVDHVAPGQVSLSRSGLAHGQPLAISKTIRLAGGRLDPRLIVELELHHRGGVAIETRLGLELNLHVLGGGGNPSAWYDLRGERSAHDGAGTAEGVDVVGYGNDWVGIAVETRPEPAADAWWSPIDTVSNSESGFERVYQGSTLLLSWPARIEPGETRRFTVTSGVAVARDRAEEERARP